MSGFERFKERILSGNADANIHFDELCRFLLSLGFDRRIRGDHHIFTRTGVAEILNLQPKRGMAKPYQVKQVRNVVVRYKLSGEKDADSL
ncbi:MAG: type II toxin-antitoxin system HicA family toxin [Leptospirillum sp.]